MNKTKMLEFVIVATLAIILIVGVICYPTMVRNDWTNNITFAEILLWFLLAASIGAHITALCIKFRRRGGNQ